MRQRKFDSTWKNRMIFMSQSGLLDAARVSAWEEWYVEHLRVMASVPGIASAQRFKTDTPGFPPSLALYSVASAAVFSDPYYQSVRGMGEWLDLIDRRYYQRNLFDGLARAPAVADAERLLVADSTHAEGAIAGIEFTWLECVGIDRSTPYRGIAVLGAAALPRLPSRVAVYRAATRRVAPA
jgi:hypothetical protein